MSKYFIRPKQRQEKPQDSKLENLFNSPVISLTSLLTVGAHFGSKKSSWNPKMAPFIYGRRNGVYILDLELTVEFWQRARDAVLKCVSEGGKVLFVNTKDQTRDLIKEEALSVNMPFVNVRWLGGTLTNFAVLKKSLQRLTKHEVMLAKAAAGEYQLTKRETLTIQRDLDKLNSTIGGLRSMTKLPDLVFVCDTLVDSGALKEAKSLGIPVIALVDTDADPEQVSYPIPANDDSNATIKLFVRAMGEAVKEGQAEYEAKQKAQEVEALESPPEAVKSDENLIVEKKV